MKRVLFILASLLTAIAVVPVLAKVLIMLLFVICHPAPPPQPTFGFTGEWRYVDVYGEAEEHPLPPADRLWQDYAAWRSQTRDRARLYVAWLGGAERQAGFHVSTNRGETPVGAQTYTHIDFSYIDPTNGTYLLSWSLPGKHDPGFLRFTDQYGLYQLRLIGSTNEYPPRLVIEAIQGIRPRRY